MKVFNVFHLYDEDGGFGDAVGQEELIASFENKSDAEEFANLLSNPHAYNKPYADLSCGYIEVREVDIISHVEFDASKIDKEQYWWTEAAHRRWVLDNIERAWNVHFEIDFSKTPFDEHDISLKCIEVFGCDEGIVTFPTGTPRTVIEAWFDANYPGGIPALKQKRLGNSPGASDMRM